MHVFSLSRPPLDQVLLDRVGRGPRAHSQHRRFVRGRQGGAGGEGEDEGEGAKLRRFIK